MRIIKLSLFLLVTMLLTQCEKAEYKNECCTHSVEVFPCLHPDSLSVWAPNAFTPNGDNINELFTIKFKNVSSQDFFVKIYQNRKSLFESKDKNFWWNGVINQKVKEGIYSYFISGKTEGGTPFEANGKFCLLLNNENKNTPIKNCDSCTFPDMIESSNGFIFTSDELLEDCE